MPLQGLRWVQRVLLTLLLLLLAAAATGVRAEIATAVTGPLLNNFDGANELAAGGVPDDGHPGQRCSSMAKFDAIAHSIDDVEDLELDVPVNIAFDYRQKKRFSLFLNASSPLTITFSQNVARKIYYNQTRNLSRSLKSDQRIVVLPCALRGQYDLFVQAKHRGSIKLEAHADHPQANWPLLNRTNPVQIRNQNRVRRRQMIVKWEKSKFDFHAVHYCLVVSTQAQHLDFCSAVGEYFASASRKLPSCFPGGAMEFVWMKPPEKARKIDPRATNIVCTGSRTKQLLRGLTANNTYYMDVFGVHTKRQNLTFHIASAAIQFNRTHPTALRANQLSVEKITGPHGTQVFSFKVPYSPQALDYRQQQSPSAAALVGSSRTHMRYLVLPCGGSEVNATILKRRELVVTRGNIYRPTYIRLPIMVQPDDRFIIRFRPTNKDEILRASKVGLAVSTARVFSHLPELPDNVTVFEVRSHCTTTTIAWYSAPEIRTMSYCIIVFNLPQRNRSAIDYTNYCMDFGKRIMQHPQFYSIKCNEKAKSPPPLETHTIFNLSPGESYLIYVTANLSNGKPLPYQSLKVRLHQQCHSELFDSRELNAYY